uniref:Large ribosomal subunit protein bL20c n=1 Tax=Gastrodia longistyla TaxID=2861180 RepID=A0A8F7GN66_9ASPA|nr:ribosomal protein L20 [Gastrodia longistyla]QXU60593.1 ribosomal protein L20 [Gastrodia longistyla]UVG40911.1 ribosomal protein L20 [Gastrodia longistyla]
MTKFKIGYKNHNCRKDFRLFASTLLGFISTKKFTQKKKKALIYAHYDKSIKRRYFRCLWITRINSVTLKNISYNLFMHNMYKKRLLLNRKICAQLILSNKYYFYIILNEMKKK